MTESLDQEGTAPRIEEGTRKKDGEPLTCNRFLTER